MKNLIYILILSAFPVAIVCSHVYIVSEACSDFDSIQNAVNFAVLELDNKILSEKIVLIK